MKKILIILILVVLAVLVFIYFIKERNNPIGEEFVQCLAEAGVVIYGSQTCVACSQLVQEYGGYDTINPIYLDCSEFGSQEELKRCFEEMQTERVPEIQIMGKLFESWGDPQALAEATGCQI